MALIRAMMEEEEQNAFTMQVRAQEEQRRRINEMRASIEERAEAAKEAQVAAATKGYGALSAEERALLAGLGGSDAEALAEMGLSGFSAGTSLQVAFEQMTSLMETMDMIDDEDIDEANLMEEEEMTYENLLENLQDVTIGMTKEAIQAIPETQKVVGDGLEACCICMCDYEESETVKKLACGHCFHQECIEQWLTSHTKCPTCKSLVQGETRQCTPEKPAQRMP